MSEPIISVSGLRGIVGTQLTPATLTRYLSAFCSTLPAGPVVLSRDGRESGPMFKAAAVATLLGHGKTVLDADVAATPTVGVLVRALSAVGGIQLTASHNPRQYNGIKLFGPDGRVLAASAGAKIREAYDRFESRWVGVEALGQLHAIETPHEGHRDRILKTVAAWAIRRRGFRVLLDVNHGSGAALGRDLLESLGCEVTVLGETPDGQFEHPPEPVEQNLRGVAAKVAEGGFDVGFCQDPDADRLALIDAQGRYVGEEYTAVLCMLNELEKRAAILAEKNLSPTLGPRTLVTNCASSSLSQHLARQFDVPLVRSAVGEANVVDAMIEHAALYGGEGSGGPIDPRVGWVRDSFVGMAQTLELMTRRGEPLARIVDALPRLAMIKDKVDLVSVDLNNAVAAILAGMKGAVPGVAPEVSTLDGLRLDWPDAWLLVRGSNTEPIVRLICEAADDATARRLVDHARSLVTQP